MRQIAWWVGILVVGMAGCAPGPVRLPAANETSQAPAVSVTGPVKSSATLAVVTAEVAPTQAPAVSPTAVERAETVTLRIANNVPEDVLNGAAVFGVGGEAGECIQQEDPLLAERALMEPLILELCWREADAQVELIVQRPDGVSEATRLAVKNGAVSVAYQPRYDYPTGKYSLRVSGAQTSRAFEVTYLPTPRARLVEISPGPFDLRGSRTYGPRHDLILDHFAPGERVRLFAYRFVSTRLEWIGWGERVTRADGRMPVRVDLKGVQPREAVFFAAYGELSGEVHLETVLDNLTLFDALPQTDLVCTGAKPPRVKAPGTARAAYTDGAPLRVRAQPGLASPVTAGLPEGTQMKLSGEVRCADGIRFWKMRAGQTAGWVAEADQSVYLIEPAE